MLDLLESGQSDTRLATGDKPVFGGVRLSVEVLQGIGHRSMTPQMFRDK